MKLVAGPASRESCELCAIEFRSSLSQQKKKAEDSKSSKVELQKKVPLSAVAREIVPQVLITLGRKNKIKKREGKGKGDSLNRMRQSRREKQIPTRPAQKSITSAMGKS